MSFKGKRHKLSSRSKCRQSLLKRLPPIEERFWARVDKVSSPFGCWLWTGKKPKNGYGRIRYNGELWLATRLAWTLFKGPIPPGKFVLHDCPGGDNPSCVRHLWLGNQTDNMQDCVKKGRWRPGISLGEKNGANTHPGSHAQSLTPKKVKKIRDLRQNTEATYKALAARFGVHKCTIINVVLRRTWRWLA